MLHARGGTPQAPADPIAQGYELFYANGPGPALTHFAGLVAAKPADLPARFGWLMAAHGRLDDDRSGAVDFEQRLDAFIDAAEARYGRDRNDADALFYLAQGHFLRATYRFEADKGTWGAARDGAKAKNYSEAYVKAHPDRADAYLALGLYNYFVDLAPTLFKALRFMLFLPAGDRALGLKQIERAAAEGPMLGPQAQLILTEIYATTEGRVADALATANRLAVRYPQSDEVGFATADVFVSPIVDDLPRAADTLQRIADRHKGDATIDGLAARAKALLSIGNIRLDQWRIDDAIATLFPIIDANPQQPDWIMPQSLLMRGNALARLNQPWAPGDANRVLAEPKWAKWHASAKAQIQWINTRNASGEAAMYASLIPGNRLVAEKKWDDARRAYEPIRAANPQNPQVRYRLAYLRFASGDAEGSLPEMLALGNSGKIVPDWLKAAALLTAARTHDLAGRRDAAKKLYQLVVDDYEKERAAGAAKLGLITPYKRPQ
jgi:tetratricopeptide (TPR) repeat protein